MKTGLTSNENCAKVIMVRSEKKEKIKKAIDSQRDDDSNNSLKYRVICDLYFSNFDL